MELRYFTKLVAYGDMLSGEKHIYETTLQYQKMNKETGKIEWLDVPFVE